MSLQSPNQDIGGCDVVVAAGNNTTDRLMRTCFGSFSSSSGTNPRLRAVVVGLMVTELMLIGILLKFAIRCEVENHMSSVLDGFNLSLFDAIHPLISATL